MFFFILLTFFLICLYLLQFEVVFDCIDFCFNRLLLEVLRILLLYQGSSLGRAVTKYLGFHDFAGSRNF
jgi:hypothetical protein